MSDFAQFGLPTTLVEALTRLNMTTPTAVQRETIPLAMEGHDILASAQTGTGKTAAFLLPLIVKLMKNPEKSALILAPTRELAMQVHANLVKIQGKSSFKTALLIGGAPMFRQISDLRRRPQLIVGTPGRVTDHLLRGTLSLDSTAFLVLDEADRMLDMGFEIQLNQIAEYLPEEKQTLMFSATLPPNIQRLTVKYLKNPKRVTIDAGLTTAPKIKQENLKVTENEKWGVLVEQLNTREGSVIIFVKTKRRADGMAKELRDHAFDSEAMHGDLPQRRREKVIQLFRNSKCRIIVATDVAARGLDIPHVMHVINYDLPECPEDYVHRIGRTGRADAEGFALSFISPSETGKWKAICRLINPEEYAKERASDKEDRSSWRGGSGQRRSNPRQGRGRSRNDQPFDRGSFNSEKSFAREDRFEKREPRFADREGFQKRNNDGDRSDRPFQKRDDFRKNDGFRKSDGFKKNDGFVKRDSFDRSEGFVKREGFAKREGFDRNEGFAKRDGFVKREGFAKREGFDRNEGFAKRETGFSKNRDGFAKRDSDIRNDRFEKKEFKDFDRGSKKPFEFKKRTIKKAANSASR